MNRDDDAALERLFARASDSAMNTLDALIDVEDRLRDLRRAAGHGRPGKHGRGGADRA